MAAGQKRSKYQPIENYGIIGNMRTAALVGMNGSIDWLCLPHFDSPSVFAAILDDRKGGRFRIAPAGDDFRNKQFYWPDTNILITRFLHADGIGEIEDYMPVGAPGPRPISSSAGCGSSAARCRSTWNAVRRSTMPAYRLKFISTEHGAHFAGPDLTLGLASSVPLAPDSRRRGRRFHARRGRERYVRLAPPGCRECTDTCCPGVGQAEDLFRATVDFWRRWLSRCTYAGRWREIVERSALTLKLLSFEPTGAIVAAPTCSLPECDRRTTQLGLSLHLDSRRGLHALRARCASASPTRRRASRTG